MCYLVDVSENVVYLFIKQAKYIYRAFKIIKLLKF